MSTLRRLSEAMTILIVLLLCGCCFAEDYVLSGYTESRGFPENGVVGSVLLDNTSVRVYLPDGLSVTLAEDAELFTGETSDINPVYIILPGSFNEPIAVDRHCILTEEAYKPAVDFPVLRLRTRTPLFRSPSEADLEVVCIEPSNTEFTVFASINTYLYVYDGVHYGFIQYSGSDLGMTQTYRHYSVQLSYIEEEYVASPEPEGLAVSGEEAIGIAMDQILSDYSEETPAHLSALHWAAFYNAAHEYGEWGSTWLVIAYGNTEDAWLTPNACLYTPFDNEMPYHLYERYLSDDYQAFLEDAPSYVTEHYANGIEDMHIHYILQVVVDRDTQNVFYAPL